MGSFTDALELPSASQGWISSIFNRWLEGSEKETLESNPTYFRTEYSKEKLDEILGAQDLEDLNDLLNVYMTNMNIWAGVIRQNTASDEDTLFEQLDAGLPNSTRLEHAIGQPALENCQLAFKACADILRSLKKLANEQKNTAQQSADQSKSKENSETKPTKDINYLVEFLYNSEAPLSLREELREFIASMLSALAIARAEERGTPLEPWLAFALSDRFKASPQRIAKIFDGISVEKISSYFAAEAEKTKIHKAVLEHWEALAIASDEGIYFPIASSHVAPKESE